MTNGIGKTEESKQSKYLMHELKNTIAAVENTNLKYTAKFLGNSIGLIAIFVFNLVLYHPSIMFHI